MTMCIRLNHLYISILWVEVCNTQISLYDIRSSQKCFNIAGVPRLDLTECEEGEAIIIHEAVQGVGRQTDQCSYRRGDCVEPIPSESDRKLKEICIGRRECSITVGVAWMRSCNAYSTYNYVIYQCAPQSELTDICSSSERTSERVGFVVSPAYPSSYPPHMKCSCDVTSSSGSNILVRYLDMSIFWSSGCEKDALVLVDGESFLSRCGFLGRNHNFTSKTNHLQLKFKSEHWQKQRGFLLRLEAFGQLKISCMNSEPLTTSLQPWNSPTRWLTTSVTHQESEHTTDVNTTQSDISTPVGLPSKQSYIPDLVLIVIAILLVSAAVVGLSFLIFWLRRRHQKQRICRLPEETKGSKFEDEDHYHRNTQSNNSNGKVTRSTSLASVTTDGQQVNHVTLTDADVCPVNGCSITSHNGVKTKNKHKKKYRVRIADSCEQQIDDIDMQDNLFI